MSEHFLQASQTNIGREEMRPNLAESCSDFYSSIYLCTDGFGQASRIIAVSYLELSA